MQARTLNWQKPDTKRLLQITAFLVIVMWLCLYGVALADAIGGFGSEKLVGRAGVTDSSLLIERSGVGQSQFDMGLGAIVSTIGHTTSPSGDIKLNGNVSDLNGAKTARVWFEWGYDTSYGNTTSTELVSTTGDFDIGISGYEPSKIVYFRAVSQTDGILYGDAKSFVAGGFAVGHNLLLALIPIVAAVGCIYWVFRGIIVDESLTEVVTAIVAASLCITLAVIILNTNVFG